MCNIEYLGRTGYWRGKLMQGFLINTQINLDEIKEKKVILVGTGDSSLYAENLLAAKGINVFAYADNSNKLWGKSIRGKKIYSLYELLNSSEYYFIITVNYDIATIRLQFMVYNIQSYSIFLRHMFHDFTDEDNDLQTILMESINMICFKNETMESAMPYIPSTAEGKDQLGKINFLMYSTGWAHWAYLWEKEIINSYGYQSVMEVGPGHGLMSLVLLKQFENIRLDWLLLGIAQEGKKLEDSDNWFDLGLKKVKTEFKDRIQEFYCILERDELPDKKYELIILTEVFEHFVVNPVNTMRKLADKLALNGRIILTTPNWGHLPIFQTWEEMPDSKDISEERYNQLLKCGHVYQYSKEELITIFNRAGLEVERYNLSDSNNHNFMLAKCEETQKTV